MFKWDKYKNFENDNTRKRSLKFVFQVINDSILHSLSDIFKSLTYVLIRFTTFERHCSFTLRKALKEWIYISIELFNLN